MVENLQFFPAAGVEDAHFPGRATRYYLGVMRREYDWERNIDCERSLESAHMLPRSDIIQVEAVVEVRHDKALPARNV